jgi:chromosome segregation ATPase
VHGTARYGGKEREGGRERERERETVAEARVAHARRRRRWRQLRRALWRSEEEGRTLKGKLQAALKDVVDLLGNVQALEADKMALEERVSAMHEGLSQTVSLSLSL